MSFILFQDLIRDQGLQRSDGGKHNLKSHVHHNNTVWVASLHPMSFSVSLAF